MEGRLLCGAVMVMLVVVEAAGPAHGKGKSSGGGGPLSQTTSGVSSRTGSSGSSSSSSSSASSSSSSDSSWDDDDDFAYDWDDDDGYSYSGNAYYPRSRPVTRIQPPGATPATVFAKPTFELTLQGMNVADSGGAFDINAWIQSGFLRIFGGNATFFEDQADGDTLVVNLYRIGGGLGWSSPGGGSRVFLDGGVGGFESPGDSVLGVMGQLELRQRMTRRVWADALVRGYLLEHDISATDLSAGVRISVVRIGYRRLDFNVGPPLHGPELGLSFSF